VHQVAAFAAKVLHREAGRSLDAHRCDATRVILTLSISGGDAGGRPPPPELEVGRVYFEEGL